MSLKFKSKKDVSAKFASPLLSLLILTPLVILFFCGGVYVGFKLTAVADKENPQQTLRIGLPGTNNVFRKWTDEFSSKVTSNLRSVPHLTAVQLPVKHTEQLIQQVTKSKTTIKDNIPMIVKNVHISEDADITKARTSSLEARKGAHLTGPKDLDNANILVAAWIYLDSQSSHDNDMRSIVSNKLPGCESTNGQHGFALFVNAWQQNDHHLHLEFGGQSSGCNKLSSGDETLRTETWYHVAVYLGAEYASLYIDGREVNSQLVAEVHGVQLSNPLLVGQYYNTEYPFFGNISHLAILHNVVYMDKSDLTSLVGTIRDSSARALSRLPHIAAVFPLTDAAHEIAGSTAAEVVHQNNGVYTFPPVRNSVQGVNIDLIDGIGNRPVTPEMIAASDELGRTRRENIKEGMMHAWRSYKKYAWGRDELKPISNTGQDNWGGMGVTLVDSLDTLWVMGLRAEFDDAKQWVKDSLSFSHASSVSVFETTIRELGGLLSAYDLSGDSVFLDKAKQLGDLLMPAFNTRSGIPTGMVNFRTGSASGGWSGNNAILSELGTLQLEFRHLAHHSGKRAYEEKSMKALQLMHQKNPAYGLFPIKINVEDGSFADSQITFGALGDSFYEYLLKVWLQGGKKETWLRDMYDAAMDGVMEKLLLASDPSGLAFLSDWNGRHNNRKMDHLVCFMPGLLALGAYNDPKGLDSKRAQRDLAVSKALMYTCYQMYHRQSTGIAPEYVEFPMQRDMVVGSTAPFYILRPETAESLFILNQLTGEPMYREWAWEIWSSIEKHCKTDSAYGSLANVNDGRHVDDRMESFFLAETMKYLYLAQDPDKPIDLTKYVFNTEAHPTRILDDSHIPVRA